MTSSGIQLQADGAMPVAVAMKNLMAHPDIQYRLLPGFPLRSQTVDQQRGQPSDLRQSSQPHKAVQKTLQKSQSGLSSRKRKQTLPPGLEGCQAVTSRGEPICFLYNLGRCPNK
eukprot:4704117-Amphidinium_carterae.1